MPAMAQCEHPQLQVDLPFFLFLIMEKTIPATIRASKSDIDIVPMLCVNQEIMRSPYFVAALSWSLFASLYFLKNSM